MGFHLDGRASMVVGTHTHIPTSDTRILPNALPIRAMLVCAAIIIPVIGMQRSGYRPFQW